MPPWRTIALLGAALLAATVATSIQSAAFASGRHRPVTVAFVLRPTWLPSGYSTSGGGWISPAGGLRVYPNTDVTESVISTAPGRQPTIPVLFTLDYYGYHDPESQSILVMASPAKPPSLPPAKPNTTIDRRRVSLSTDTQGALHNLNVDVSWIEGGDVIDVSTQGLPVAQVTRFVAGLARAHPPRHPNRSDTASTLPHL